MARTWVTVRRAVSDYHGRTRILTYSPQVEGSLIMMIVHLCFKRVKDAGYYCARKNGNIQNPLCRSGTVVGSFSIFSALGRSEL